MSWLRGVTAALPYYILLALVVWGPCRFTTMIVRWWRYQCRRQLVRSIQVNRSGSSSQHLRAEARRRSQQRRSVPYRLHCQRSVYGLSVRMSARKYLLFFYPRNVDPVSYFQVNSLDLDNVMLHPLPTQELCFDLPSAIRTLIDNLFSCEDRDYSRKQR